MCFKTAFATLAKNPNSSKKMDIIVIDKNRIKILIGLIEELLINPSNTSLNDIAVVNKRVNAPTRAITQYKFIVIFLILMLGLRMHVSTMLSDVNTATTIVNMFITAINHSTFI